LIAVVQYKIQGYSVRQDFLFRNYFPLLAVFLSWSGFGSPYAANVIKMTLEEHYRRDKSRVRAVDFIDNDQHAHPYLKAPNCDPFPQSWQ
jgi:hypothetical protein